MNHGPLRDASGTITTGGTAQTALAAATSRKILIFQNVSDADMWVNFGGTAAAANGSLLFPAGTGQTFESFVPDGAVSIYGATTGKGFTLKEG